MPFLQNPWEDGFYDREGQWLELHWAPIAECQQAIETCLLHPERAEVRDVELLQTLHFAFPLFDPEDLLEGWKETVPKYPEGLREEHVQRYFLDSCQALRVVVDYGPCPSPALIYPQDIWATSSFYRAMAALNDCLYFSGWQAEFYLKDFRRTPNRCYERLLNITRSKADEASIHQGNAQCVELLEEAGALLESFLPGSARVQRAQKELGECSVLLLSGRETGSGKGPRCLFNFDGVLRDGLHDRLTALSSALRTPPAPLYHYAARNAAVYFYGRLRDNIQLFLEALFLLNSRRSAPREDFIRSVERLPLQPPRCYERLMRLFRASNPREAFLAFERLVSELGALITPTT